MIQTEDLTFHYKSKEATFSFPNISLIGYSSKLEWKKTRQSLKVQFPKEKPCEFAYVLKIER